MTAPWRIGPLHIPASIDDDDAEDFIAANALNNLLEGLLWGNNDHWVSPAVRLAGSQPSPYTARHYFVAKDGERVIGRADVELPLQDNLDAAFVHVAVHPEYQRRGLGTALYTEAERCMRGASRSTFMAWSDHSATPCADATDVLRPRSGPGTLPGASNVVKFSRALGYELEQVERFGVLHLPIDVDEVAEAARNAGQRAGEDYELLVWEDRCPDDMVDQYAYLRHLMSVDVPIGELDIQEEEWDAGRVRVAEERLLQQDGHSLVATVRHIPSNQLVGHTILECYPDKPEVIYQEDTLVLSAHRGHQLGMLLKAHNLLRLQELWPRAERLYTWNAAENEHMLDINIALGFEVAGYVGAWQKKLG